MKLVEVDDEDTMECLDNECRCPCHNDDERFDYSITWSKDNIPPEVPLFEINSRCEFDRGTYVVGVEIGPADHAHGGFEYDGTNLAKLKKKREEARHFIRALPVFLDNCDGEQLEDYETAWKYMAWFDLDPLTPAAEEMKDLAMRHDKYVDDILEYMDDCEQDEFPTENVSDLPEELQKEIRDAVFKARMEIKKGEIT